jgi:hypothetical protein
MNQDCPYMTWYMPGMGSDVAEISAPASMFTLFRLRQLLAQVNGRPLWVASSLMHITPCSALSATRTGGSSPRAAAGA